MGKVELIREAIDKALKRQSKLTPLALSIPMLGSLNIRHLLNNLGAISTVYLDAGSHCGGSYCSTVCENSNLTDAIAVDNWLSDDIEGKEYEKEFRENVSLIHLNGTKTHIIKSDAFSVDLSNLPKIDFVYYDSGHSYEDQRKAVTYYLPFVTDEFLFVVDDWQYGDVKRGTKDGLAESNLEILFEQELLNPEPYTDDQHLNDHWWRGFYVALLKKKQ